MKNKINLIDPLEFTDAIKEINQETKKAINFNPKLFIPSEDPDGYFHELAKNITEVRDGNYRARMKLGKYLLSDDFQGQLYREVGQFLGYEERDVSKKIIKKKISDAVISSNFQGRRDLSIRHLKNTPHYQDAKNGQFKYLDIPEHGFFNIWPSEKKGVQSSCFIKNKKLFIQDAVADLRFRGKINFKTHSKKGKRLYSSSCSFQELELINSTGHSINDSFYTRPPLLISPWAYGKGKRRFERFFLESKKIECREISRRTGTNAPISNYYSIELSNLLPGKSSFKLELDSDALTKKINFLAFPLISRPITSKDLILDAEWIKLDKRARRIKINSMYFSTMYKNRYFYDQLKENKNAWDFKFKNTAANRKKLHQFFLKSNFKTEHWGTSNDDEDSLRSAGGNDFLVTGDFILNIGVFFRKLNFPVERIASSEDCFKPIGNPEHLNDVIYNIIVKNIMKLNSEYKIIHKKEFLRILSTVKKYEKPVALNESFAVAKGVLGSMTDELSKYAVDLMGERSGKGFYNALLFSRRTGYGSIEDPVLPHRIRQLQSRIWNIIHKKLSYTPSAVHGLGVGSVSSNRLIEDMSDYEFSQQHHIDYTLSHIEDILLAKNSKQLKELSEWLNAEQLHFSQSYFKNFEKHPLASSRKHKKVLQKYQKMKKEEVVFLFGQACKRFMSSSMHGDESPEKIMQAVYKKYDKEVSKHKKLFSKRYKDLPTELDREKPNISVFWFRLNWKELSKHHIPEEEFIENSLFMMRDEIKKKAGFPVKSNPLIRYATNSYKSNGKQLKIMKERYSAAIRNKTNIDDSIVAIRRWLAEEETDFIKITAGLPGLERSKFRETKESQSWFYYPDYLSSSLRKLFNLQNMYKNSWDKNLISAITQMMNLIKTDDGLAVEFDKAISYKQWQLRKELTKKGTDLEKNTEKLKNLNLVLEQVSIYSKMQDHLNINKSFYGVGDSLLRIVLFTEGLNPYDVRSDLISQLNSLSDKNTELPGFSDNIPYKEKIDKAVKADIQSIINFYEKALTDLISHFDSFHEESVDEVDITTKSYTKNNLGTILSCWEVLNHFKALKKYIKILCKYDLYDLRKNEDEVDKYILKKDANLLIRKSNKTSSINGLLDLKDYLKMNKLPNFQNNNKYRELTKLIRDEPLIKKYKIRGEDYIERQGLILWMKARPGYRGLKSLKFSEYVQKHLAMESLVMIEHNFYE